MKKELEARTKRFALSVIEFVGKLPRSKVSDVIGLQLLKSGTSIGANYGEVSRAQTHDDFIHKLAICEKETAETEYWLELTMEANLTTLTLTEELLGEVREPPNPATSPQSAHSPSNPQSAFRNSHSYASNPF